MNLNELAKQVHAANIKWWQDLETGKPIQRNQGQLLMLVITELAEAVEGIRKNLQDDKLPQRTMEEVEMADAFIRLLDFAAGFKLNLSSRLAGHHRIENMPEDKAEAILRICNCVVDIYWVGIENEQCGFVVSEATKAIEIYCQKNRLDLMGAYEEKMKFNATREDHSHEARKLANGKKF